MERDGVSEEDKEYEKCVSEMLKKGYLLDASTGKWINEKGEEIEVREKEATYETRKRIARAKNGIFSELNLQADEPLIGYGEVESLTGIKCTAFLTSKRFIIQQKENPGKIVFLGLESIERVYQTTRSGSRGRVVICMVFNDQPRLCMKNASACSFIPKLGLCGVDYLKGFLGALNGVYTNYSAMQKRLTSMWVTNIQNAIRDKEIADLKKGAFIKAWKCEYCETLNEAQKETCSHCRSPRKSEKSNALRVESP